MDKKYVANGVDQILSNDSLWQQKPQKRQQVARQTVGVFIMGTDLPRQVTTMGDLFPQLKK